MVGMADGIAREGFDRDLAYGKAKESEFVDAISNARVEIKSDQRAVRNRPTGNVAIEYMQKGRPSGINVTTAGWWAIEFDEGKWIVVQTALLKRYAHKAYREGRVGPAGDYNQYENAFVPLSWLLKEAPALGPATNCQTCGDDLTDDNRGTDNECLACIMR